jgi:UDP-2,3-diacylglucosamine hydrolase
LTPTKGLKYQEQIIHLPEGKKAYFASDFHLEASQGTSNRQREANVVQWLRAIKPYCGALFLVGDIFDFWHEYKYAVPKGNIRLMGMLADYRDSGIHIYLFSGNHDIWMYDYFEKELDVSIYRQPQIFYINEKKFFIAHGDGLGPGDRKFKLLKKIFTFPFFQWCFRWVHPDIGIKIATLWSEKSRTDPAMEQYMGDDREFLLQYVRKKSEEIHCDFFVFGHRHLPLDINLSADLRYINLGDWIVNNTYLEYDQENCYLKKYL